MGKMEDKKRLALGGQVDSVMGGNEIKTRKAIGRMGGWEGGLVVQKQWNYKSDSGKVLAELGL